MAEDRQRVPPDGRQYIVIENAGMVDAQDVGKFGTRWAAEKWLEKTYSVNERDRAHPLCLFPDICVEIDGVRSYDI
ncbi:hypothetical protein [Sphingobium aromaticiconvertens]|uniref:hypothetical protein n=1 Tax=Sphingobium aromaticiconvertens TaxID=365341 RepID=UPI00301B2B0F